MIAIDTNVLVRYLVEDEPEQAETARVLFEGLSSDAPGFISLVVLCEMVSALGYTYRWSRLEIGRAVTAMLGMRQLVVEHPEIAARAVASQSADISDAIIHEIGRANGCSKTLTFDRRFARLAGVERLGGG